MLPLERHAPPFRKTNQKPKACILGPTVSVSASRPDIESHLTGERRSAAWYLCAGTPDSFRLRLAWLPKGVREALLFGAGRAFSPRGCTTRSITTYFSVGFCVRRLSSRHYTSHLWCLQSPTVMPLHVCLAFETPQCVCHEYYATHWVLILRSVIVQRAGGDVQRVYY